MDLIGEEPSLEVVKKLLQDLISTNADSNISLDAIVKVIADNYQISVSDLKGKKRDKKFALPRQIAVYLSRELTEITYTVFCPTSSKMDLTAWKQLRPRLCA